MNGALLINKHAGVSSFGIIEELQRQLVAQTGMKRRDFPKMGHGGTLDPFATGLLMIFINRGVKLAQYFLGSVKAYEGTIRFGETTIPGDPTAPISEKSDQLPESLEQLRDLAQRLTLQPYLQIPPMHSAKKVNGKALYELAHQGLEIEREPRLCHLYEFTISEYQKPKARIRVKCSSGTYIRTLAQDFAKLLGTVAMLEDLTRSGSGAFSLSGHSSGATAMSVAEIGKETAQGKKWDELPCWVPFDRLMDGHDHVAATSDEARAIVNGKQNVLFNILRRIQPGNSYSAKEPDPCVAIYENQRLLAIVRKNAEQGWSLDRVFG